MSLKTERWTIDRIVETLDRSRQRATYGAVAAVLGRPEASLMAGRPRSPLNSWIVRSDTGLPTGYPREQLHPDLLRRENWIDDPSVLREWLEDPPPSTPGVELARKLEGIPEVLFVSESREGRRSRVLVLLERDPPDVLGRVFDAEHELYGSHSDWEFDVRVTLGRLFPDPPRVPDSTVHLDRIQNSVD